MVSFFEKYNEHCRYSCVSVIRTKVYIISIQNKPVKNKGLNNPIIIQKLESQENE
jgi:hypothetical protein